jgi:hypothetical protein
MPKKQKKGKASGEDAKIRKAVSVLSPLNPKIKLDPVVKAYFQMLLDPFERPPVGLPLAPAIGSSKEKFVIKGSGSCGTTAGGASKYGFAVLSLDSCFYNDEPCFWASNVAAGKTALDYDSATVTALQANGYANTKARYTRSQVGSPATGAIMARVVAAGLRLKPIGPADAIGGTAIVINPQAGSVPEATNIDAVLALNSARNVKFARDHWTTVVWTPDLVSDYEYKTSPGLDEMDPGSTTNPAHLVIVVINDGATSQSFEMEAVVHVEYVGNPGGQNTTVTPPSPAHHAVADTVVKHAEALSRPTHKQDGSFLKTAESILNGVTDFFESPVVQGIGSAALGLLL